MNQQENQKPKMNYYHVTRIVQEEFQVYAESKEDVKGKIENPYSVTVIKETIRLIP